MLICLDQRTGAGCGAQNRDGARHCVKCGMSLRFALQLQNPGAVIGHYRIVRVLGHGGFGAVYEAEDTQQPGLHVALKETFDPTSIGSYQKEFAVLRTLQHPNLPRYYEMFEYLGNGYLVMELVPGQSLDEVLDSQAGQPLLESQVLGYTIQVCDALSYLHSQNPPIIHRDIKPANIRITPAGLIKLVDFGLLKQGTGTTQSSRRGLTPAYAPIEQYGLVAGLHTDPRSDIYSLGATLYHLLTGQVPLPAADRIAVTPDPLPPPQRVNPRLSPHVASAVMTAMNLLPKDRYADAATMKQALLKQPVHAPVPPQGAPHVANVPQTLPVANKPPLAVALTVALLVITGVPGLLVGVGAIGILAAILMWFGKKWGRRIGIVYLALGSAAVGMAEIGLLFSAYGEYCDLDSSRGCRWIYRFHAEYAVAGVFAALVFTLGVLALLALFRDDVLDFFYPHNAPHRKWAGQSVAIVAWSQILLGFWLVLPLILGFGLLYRKRWALRVTRLLAPVGTLSAIPMFLVGLGLTTNSTEGFIVVLFAHLTFLVNSIAWYIFTRREVEALF